MGTETIACSSTSFSPPEETALKQWNLGNTTVRNPERLKGGLRVLKEEFEGQEFDYPTQDRYYDRLLARGVVEGDPRKAESRRQSARKWAAAFNQLGLAKCWQRRPPIQITPPGEALLDGGVLDEDVFLRQLLKVQLPSPTEGGSDEIFSVHPLFVVISVALALSERGKRGITKEEIAILVQTTADDDSVDDTIERIVQYREGREAERGKVAKRAFFLRTLRERVGDLYAEELRERFEILREVRQAASKDPEYLSGSDADRLLREVTATGKGSNVKSAVEARDRLKAGIRRGDTPAELREIVAEHVAGRQMGTLEDYADTTIRYSRVTGLFTLDGDKLALKEDQVALATALRDQGAPELLDDDEFLEQFYTADAPWLPTDDVTFLREDIERLQDRRKELATEVPVLHEPEPEKPAAGILELRQQRQRLEEDLLLRKEVRFYQEQREPAKIREIHELFGRIDRREVIGGSDYLPAWAEWAAWRVMLAIDSISGDVHDTRNFEIDTDLNPIHHARAGVADMIFRYDDTLIIPVEVTLHKGERQYAAEGEPVQRHALRISDDNRDKEVITVFAAPVIHPATAHEFFKAEMYSDRRDEVVELAIVPLTMEQLASLMPGMANGCPGPGDLRALLHELLRLREGCSNGKQWLAVIDGHLSLAAAA